MAEADELIRGTHLIWLASQKIEYMQTDRAGPSVRGPKPIEPLDVRRPIHCELVRGML